MYYIVLERLGINHDKPYLNFHAKTSFSSAGHSHHGIYFGSRRKQAAPIALGRVRCCLLVLAFGGGCVFSIQVVISCSLFFVVPLTFHLFHSRRLVVSYNHSMGPAASSSSRADDPNAAAREYEEQWGSPGTILDYIISY